MDNQETNLIEDKTNFKRWYLAVVGFFYAGQGYSLGSMALLLPLYMLNELNANSRASAVSTAAIMIFPWYIKFVFGIITDNYPIRGNRRKPYLIIATLCSLFGWSFLGSTETINVIFIMSGVLLAIGSALGDAVIDGMSIEITPNEYAGRLQGVNWGSRGLGLGGAGIISANIVENYSWDTLFLVAGVFGVSITLITLLLPERNVDPEFFNSSGNKFIEIIESIKGIFRKPKSKERVSYFLFSGFTLSIILQLTLIMETEFGYSFEEIGIGALSFAVGTFLGSIVNGVFADRRDDLSGFIGLSVAYGLAILSGYIFTSYRNFEAELVFFFFIGLFGGAYEAYQLKVIQEETEENLESTIFGIYTGISNLGQFAFGGILIVLLADTLGIPILISMQVVLLILIVTMYYLNRLKFT